MCTETISWENWEQMETTVLTFDDQQVERKCRKFQFNIFFFSLCEIIRTSDEKESNKLNFNFVILNMTL